MEKQELTAKEMLMIEKYFAVRVGDFRLRCPYFMNERGSRNLSIPYSGKALPEEIEAEAERIIKSRQLLVDNEQRAENLMRMCGLGIDCSGLVTNILNERFKRTLGMTIYKALKYPTLKWKVWAMIRPRMNVSAALLTGDLNSMEVKVDEVRPGDIIRRNTNHVMLVEVIENNKITYVHSDEEPEWGIQRGEIVISNRNKGLGEQKWLVERDRKLYTQGEKSGLRRLIKLS